MKSEHPKIHKFVHLVNNLTDKVFGPSDIIG